MIGTHKLLQDSMKFKQLGLVVVDEEHRFGVQHKERLKALRTEMDVLTLTATPIPRTLNLAMAGLRDLSIIATPPAGRLAVKTFVGEWNPAIIREACQRELKRGGQIYFLHNEVETIQRMAAELRFDVARSPSLPEAVRARLRALAGRRVNQDGELLITARRFRSQERNRQDAIDRLIALIRQAAEPPRPRFKTRPSRAAKERRMEEKRRVGEKKQIRRSVGRAGEHE